MTPDDEYVVGTERYKRDLKNSIGFAVWGFKYLNADEAEQNELDAKSGWEDFSKAVRDTQDDKQE